MFSDSTTRQVDRRYFGNRSTFSGSIAVIYVALSFALFGLLSLRDTFSQSEERQYIAFAALVGNVGEQLVLLTTVNGERARFFSSDCVDLKGAVSALGNQLPPSASPEVSVNLHSATAATVAICRASLNIHDKIHGAAMRAELDRSYGTAVTIFIHDFLERFPQSHEELETALFLGHPYLRASIVRDAL